MHIDLIRTGLIFIPD